MRLAGKGALLVARQKPELIRSELRARSMIRRSCLALGTETINTIN